MSMCACEGARVYVLLESLPRKYVKHSSPLFRRQYPPTLLSSTTATVAIYTASTNAAAAAAAARGVGVFIIPNQQTPFLIVVEEEQVNF